MLRVNSAVLSCTVMMPLAIFKFSNPYNRAITEFRLKLQTKHRTLTWYFFSTACGRSLVDEGIFMRIIGGTEAKRYAWPWMVYVFENDQPKLNKKKYRIVLLQCWAEPEFFTVIDAKITSKRKIFNEKLMPSGLRKDKHKT